MVTVAQIDKLDQLADAVAGMTRVVVEGLGTGRAFDCVERAPTIRLAYRGVISHDTADQVVSVRAGTPIEELQEELRPSGQCIPWGGFPWQPDVLPGTVGGRLSQNLPHAYEASCGNWRDWVLGVTVVRSNGTIAKAGSKAVKNVAGYDVQKLFTGARGTLGVVAEVILRTFPIKALPAPDLKVFIGDWPRRGMIQRTLRTEFSAACEAAGDQLAASHPATHTLYRAAEDLSAAPMFTDDWVLGWGFGPQNVRIDDPIFTLMGRAKSIFDPQNKLNPGELNVG